MHYSFVILFWKRKRKEKDYLACSFLCTLKETVIRSFQVEDNLKKRCKVLWLRWSKKLITPTLSIWTKSGVSELNDHYYTFVFFTGSGTTGEAVDYSGTIFWDISQSCLPIHPPPLLCTHFMSAAFREHIACIQRRTLIGPSTKKTYC